MKYSLKFLFMLANLMALAITLTPTQAEKELTLLDEDDNNDDASNEIPEQYIPWAESKVSKTVSLRGSNRFVALKMTCDKYPRVCRIKGSPGRDCCKKKCVNVMTDRLNCGRCGNKCKFSETCCKGQCVNPFSNKKHCGGCNTKCKKGSSCVYGMCSYA